MIAILALEIHPVPLQIPAIGFERIDGQALLYPAEIKEVRNVMRERSLACRRGLFPGLGIAHPTPGTR
jgi:hypothetical protein